MYKNWSKNFVANWVRIPLISFLSSWNEIKKACDQFLTQEKSLTGICAIYTTTDWKILLIFFSGEFESIFVSKISTEGQSCFLQDLCPQMALYSRLWAWYLFCQWKMAGVVGIEPTSKVLETPILPLNHTPIIEGKHPSIMVRQQGLEPRTDRLWAGCSNQLSYWRTNVSAF